MLFRSQHLTHEARSKLRNAVSARLAVNLFGRDPQRLRRGKERDDLGIGQRQSARVDPGQVHPVSYTHLDVYKRQAVRTRALALTSKRTRCSLSLRARSLASERTRRPPLRRLTVGPGWAALRRLTVRTGRTALRRLAVRTLRSGTVHAALLLHGRAGARPLLNGARLLRANALLLRRGTYRRCLLYTSLDNLVLAFLVHLKHLHLCSGIAASMVGRRRFDQPRIRFKRPVVYFTMSKPFCKYTVSIYFAASCVPQRTAPVSYTHL